MQTPKALIKLKHFLNNTDIQLGTSAVVAGLVGSIVLDHGIEQEKIFLSDDAKARKEMRDDAMIAAYQYLDAQLETKFYWDGGWSGTNLMYACNRVGEKFNTAAVKITGDVWLDNQLVDSTATIRARIQLHATDSSGITSSFNPPAFYIPVEDKAELFLPGFHVRVR